MFVEIENKIFDFTQLHLDLLNKLLAEVQSIDRKYNRDTEEYEYTANYSVYKLRPENRCSWKTIVKHEVLEKAK